MRHASTLQTIGWGLLLGALVVTPDRVASADGPRLLNMFQAAHPVASPTVRGWTRPPFAPAGSGLPGPQPVMSGPDRANRVGSLIRPNGGNWQVVPKIGGAKRSWDIVPKGVAADSGGSWVVAPKWTGVGPVGNKSPGQGSAPPSMAFPEPNHNGPQRTSPSSTRARAPEANPPSSTCVRAPSAPDPTPGTTPNPGPQNPGGSAAPGGPSLGDWVAAAGAIVDMANSVTGNGNMGYGNVGYGDTGYGEMGYGDAGGSYAYDPTCTTVYEGSYPSNMVGSVVSDVPANPSPVTPMNIAIVNPTANGVALQFLLDGQLQTLEAGTRLDFTVARPVEIKFDRGEQFGRGRYQLTGYLYTFRPSDRGWELYRSQYVAQ